MNTQERNLLILKRYKDKLTLHTISKEFGLSIEGTRKIINKLGYKRENKIKLDLDERKKSKFASRILKFWDNVDIKNDNECWEWSGRKCIAGYGDFSFVALMGTRTDSYAHRIAWTIVNGKITEGLQILHKCDNRACCNPNHLYLGTAADNVRDREERYFGIPVKDRKYRIIPRRIPK